MSRNLRMGAALVFMLLCTAAVFAEPLPVPQQLYQSGNLLTNSSFENGTTNWVVTKNSGKAKVKCNDAGAVGMCAFYFKGVSAEHTATIQQTYRMPDNSPAVSLVVNGGYWQRSASGTSCLTATIKVIFKDASDMPEKRVRVACGTGVAGAWENKPDGFFVNTSVASELIKRVVVTIKHTGVGEWYVDAPKIKFSEK